MTERKYFCQADAVGSQPVEMYSLEKQRNKLVVSSTLDLKDMVRDLTETTRSWLPIASEKLNISPRLQDYILTPVISMPSDLPNRNSQSFPLSELTGWCVDAGMPAYKTWVGMPTHLEHQNRDPTIAKGIIFDCMMRPIHKSYGDIWKVLKLAGWDRTRDPLLCNDILSGKRHAYSMGAHSRDFSCSVCGNLLSGGGCDHLTHGKPNYKLYSNRLAHYNVVDIRGFELSSVASPAYTSASNVPYFMWN